MRKKVFIAILAFTLIFCGSAFSFEVYNNNTVKLNFSNAIGGSSVYDSFEHGEEYSVYFEKGFSFVSGKTEMLLSVKKGADFLDCQESLLGYKGIVKEGNYISCYAESKDFLDWGSNLTETARIYFEGYDETRDRLTFKVALKMGGDNSGWFYFGSMEELYIILSDTEEIYGEDSLAFQLAQVGELGDPEIMFVSPNPLYWNNVDSSPRPSGERAIRIYYYSSVGGDAMKFSYYFEGGDEIIYELSRPSGAGSVDFSETNLQALMNEPEFSFGKNIYFDITTPKGYARSAPFTILEKPQVENPPAQENPPVGAGTEEGEEPGPEAPAPGSEGSPSESMVCGNIAECLAKINLGFVSLFG